LADNRNTNEPMEPEIKHLDDFKGTPTQIRKAKSDWIKKWGYDKYEELVRNSSIHVKR